MIEKLFNRLDGALDRVEGEVARRKDVSGVDAVADGMVFAVKELRRELAAVKAETETLSAEEYAELHSVTPQTVRTWIRAGEIPDVDASVTPYRIPRDAKHTPRKLKRAS